MIRTLLIDNHDSFTWNLVHDLTRVNGAEPVVVPNDWDRWATEGPGLLDRIDNVVISPGPGTPLNPVDVGIGPAVIAAAVARGLPVLGICLGHQLIAHLYGATVGPAVEPVHGRISAVSHGGAGLFRGVPSPCDAVRYHSLAVTDLPATVTVDARTDDGTVMGISVPGDLLWGVQFHPESVETGHGLELLANFAELTAELGRTWRVRDRVVPLGEVADTGTRSLSEVVFHTLFGEADHAVWLDGNSAGDPRARFSVMGAADGANAGPSAAVVTADVAAGTVTVTRATHREVVTCGVLDWLASDLARWNIRGNPLRDSPEGDPVGDLPFGFRLGWVGYLGYGVKAQCCAGEGGPNRHSAAGIGQPDAGFVFLDRAVVFDHDRAEAHLLVLDGPGSDGTDATVWIEAMAAQVRRLATVAGESSTGVEGTPVGADTPDGGPRVSASLRLHDRAGYTAKVRKIQELIAAGETYEACLTTTLQVDSRDSCAGLYRELRRDNPAPFGAYLRLPGVTVMSTSPERFLRVDREGVVTSSPIKGTRPVGRDAREDLLIRAELQHSEKDRAENLMIVDLVRHDLGKVAAAGTVQVPELFSVESYATVHQLVSTVTARLGRGNSGVDAVREAFPPGSMTGAPKERTMRILEELEDAPRGVYSGAVGYFSLDGAVDLSVAIRTLVSSSGGLTYGVGGAVVTLSEPDAEYDETVVKARPVQRLG